MRQLPWLLVLAWAGTSAAQTQLVAAANLKEVIVSGTRSKQIIIAAGDGAKAALSAFDHLIRSSVPA